MNKLSLKKMLLISGITTILITSLVGCASNKNSEYKNPVPSNLECPLVDTNQGLCYDNKDQIEAPSKCEAFYGQDAQYTSNVPTYTDNGNGTMNTPQGGMQNGPNFSKAAEILNITEAELKAAFGESTQSPFNFEAIAKKLGITEQELLDALEMQNGVNPENPGALGRRN